MHHEIYKANYAKIMQTYARHLKIMQCSLNALLCKHYAKIMQIIQTM